MLIRTKELLAAVAVLKVVFGKYYGTFYAYKMSPSSEFCASYDFFYHRKINQ
jgi:hypothetical protein